MDKADTVILLDDDKATRRSMAVALEFAGYRVETYASADEMLEGLDPGQPGCLLLDLRMPGMSGLEVQEALNARGCTMPVIFLSAFAAVPATVRAIRGGAIDFLEKPCPMGVLTERIEDALEIDRSQREERNRQRGIRSRAADLTRREAEVLHSVTEGLSNKEAARQLSISPRTVEKYRARVMEKMEAESIPDLCWMVSVLADPDPAPRA